MLQDLVGKMSPTPQFSFGSYLPMESESVKIPRFNGDDPAAWVFQVEQYFTHYNTFSDHKLSLASLYLDGEALNWYCWLYRNKQLVDWDHFVAKLFIRFRTQSREAPDRRLALLRQLTTVSYCPTLVATTSSWSTMANSPSPQYWNVGSDHNNQTFAHKVFGKMPDGKIEKVVDVETMLQTPNVLESKDEYKDTPVQVKTEGDDVWSTQAKQEICNSKELTNPDLDDNEEDPLPLVLAADTNVQGDQPLQITETGVEVIENKVQNLFGIYPPKATQYFFGIEMVDSLWERSNPLILDGARLMHKHILINFPFDPGESVSPSIILESLDIHLDASHYLSNALYSSGCVLEDTTNGDKLFNGMFSSKMCVQNGQPWLPRPLPKSLFSTLILNFLAQIEKSVEIAKEFDFDGSFIIGEIDSKMNACVAAILQELKVSKLRSENKVKLQVVHPTGYTFYGVIKMVKLDACHRLRQCLVAMKRFGRNQTPKIVHQYFKVDNFSFDGFDHVNEYYLYHTSSESGASFDRGYEPFRVWKRASPVKSSQEKL